MAASTALQRHGSEGRRFHRVRVNLFGSYMLADGQESQCQIIDMSPGGIAVTGLVTASAHERVVVYADQLGRLETTAVRVRPDGFAATISASPKKRDKLATQLTWLANRDLLREEDLRRHERRVPSDPRSTLTMPNGTRLPCAIIDMSPSGAAIACARKLPVGILVTVGRIQSRVMRHIDVGLVVEFTRVRDPSLLEDAIADPYDITGPVHQAPPALVGPTPPYRGVMSWS
ncbi:MAG: PilZ domain-containing protein [Xanthobacteraceae bacterium]|jgi:hypothetical protein